MIDNIASWCAIIAAFSGVAGLLFRAKVKEQIDTRLDALDEIFVRKDVQEGFSGYVRDSISRLERKQDVQAEKLNELLTLINRHLGHGK